MAPSIHVDYSTQLKQSDTMSGKKMQGFSKGYASGFVSDYRHAVHNNVDVSEGLGSSGRFDAEMSASEDSSSPKRKCISLNADSSDRVVIPKEVFKLSKMSRSERKRLRMRLKTELHRVQSVQRKVSFRVGNTATVSASSDIRSCSNGNKGSSEFSSKRDMKKAPALLNSKRGISGRFQSFKQESVPGYPISKLMEQCETLLKRLMDHQYGYVFNTPVDVVKLNIPDYFTIIKHPMDFGTIKKNLASGRYSNPWGFLADVRLTFSNAILYNPSTNDVHLMAKTLSKFFEARWKYIQRKLPPCDSGPIASRPNDLKPVDGKSNVSRVSNNPKASSPSKKRKISSMDVEIRKDPVKPAWIEAEKNKLTRDIESFADNLPEYIVDFLREHSCSEGQAVADDEITVDIDVFSDDALFTLRKLVDDFLKENQRTSAKVVPCELQAFNETRHKRTPTELVKGNEPVDEDVDICGNDPPVTSYSPVEIEKDTAHRSSRHSSSSSSSSDPSSSSSDSDTGSSSSSDSDGANASSPINRTQENQLNNHAHLQNGNQSVSGLDQFDRNPCSTPISSEVDSRQVESNGPSERPISTDEQYRKALLKRRFADTILKAQEKTLNQGEKGDPEKLRREREELERRQREERIRLQAEARAAEDSRKKAEAEAAAEAKRKRELDREAARRALLEMEKTVEINENCHFLEDLEMLRSVSAPHLPLAEATSPDHFSDDLGGFKLQGSNPLEQLGLYMKMDDEEEEEGGPTTVPEPNNDVEEGEID